MIQEIITLTIVFASLAYTIYRTISLFKVQASKGCSGCQMNKKCSSVKH